MNNIAEARNKILDRIHAKEAAITEGHSQQRLVQTEINQALAMASANETAEDKQTPPSNQTLLDRTAQHEAIRSEGKRMDAEIKAHIHRMDIDLEADLKRSRKALTDALAVEDLVIPSHVWAPPGHGLMYAPKFAQNYTNTSRWQSGSPSDHEYVYRDRHDQYDKDWQGFFYEEQDGTRTYPASKKLRIHGFKRVIFTWTPGGVWRR